MSVGSVAQARFPWLVLGSILLIAGAVVASGCGGSHSHSGAIGAAPTPTTGVVAVANEAIVPGERPATTANAVESPTSSAPAAKPARPAVLVAASESGRLVVIDTKTGATVRALVDTRVKGAECGLGEVVSLTPDAKFVYYSERAKECIGEDKIYRIAVAGGKAQFVADGHSPRVSPDGKSLSLLRRQGESNQAAYFIDIASGAEIPAKYSVDLGCQVSTTWSPDSTSVLFNDMQMFDPVSCPGRLTTVNATTLEQTYVKAPADWSHAAYAPGHGIFVLQEASTLRPGPYADRMIMADPKTAVETSVIATGFDRTTTWHDSLDSDVSGDHLLYVANTDLMVSDYGNRPVKLATGITGADW